MKLYRRPRFWVLSIVFGILTVALALALGVEMTWQTGVVLVWFALSSDFILAMCNSERR